MEVKEEVRAFPGNGGALRAGIGSLPGVLSIKVRVLLRPGGVEGYPGELDTTSAVFSCVYFQASLSADRLPYLPLLSLSMAVQRLCHRF